MNIDINYLGFDSRAEEALRYPGLEPGRVISQSKTLYRTATRNGEVLAQVSGSFRQHAASPLDFPAAGDFVMMEIEGGSAVIHNVLERKSVFVRKAAGKTRALQAVAANIDLVFICMDMDNDFNLRRLERYLSIAWDSGAVPVVVLTKSDLCADAEEKTALAESCAIGADVIVTSAALENGADVLKPYISGRTAAFLGSSGVGKSSLINRLAGEEILETAETSENGRGRHTTTRREIITVCGGAVIDTPGMREIGVESADFSLSFSDIDELAENCRFRDCSHKSEPGCAVLAAVEEGVLSSERLASYHKLKIEADYEGLNHRQIEVMKTSRMMAGFGGIKNAKRYIKSRNKQ